MFRQAKLSLFIAVLALALGALYIPAAGLPAHAASESCDLKAAFLYGSESYGLNCLDSAGWHTYGKDNADLSSASVWGLCTDGTVIVGGLEKVGVFDGGALTEISGSGDIPKTIACASAKDLWIGYLGDGKIGHYDGKSWTYFTAKDNLGTDFGLLYGMTLTADGKLWVTTSDSIAVYDGKAWKAFNSKNGLPEFTDFSSPAVFDSKGTLYATASSALIKYDGKTFSTVKIQGLSVAKAVAIDAQDKLYVGGQDDGLFVYDGKKWKNYTSKDGLSSNTVDHIAVDAKNRVWLSTEWGLSVLDAGKFTVFKMANSDLLDNRADAVLVIGDGPALPKTVDKKPGSVKGTLVEDGTPLSKKKVQLCSESAGFMYSGDTPCGDMPDAQTTTTDDAGSFEFKNVPVGHYTLGFQDIKTKWAQLTPGGNADVQEGQETDLSTLSFKSQ